MVVHPKTKKASNRVFTITDKTRLVRAGKPVRVADVSARKDEKVAVVVDHDKPGDEAIEVRFEVLANFAYFWMATLTMARAVSTGGGLLVAALAIHAVLAVWFALVLFGGTPTAARHE